MQLSEDDLKRFNKRMEENFTYFWSRFDSIPSFVGKSVLDIGCGRGPLCIDMARRGAAQVMGIDIKKSVIDFADANLRLNFPELVQVIEFRLGDIASVADCEFDLIVSKNSFEHIIEPDKCLIVMIRKLKPAGRIYIGFSPLYNSPRGDHGRTKTFHPWGHVLVPESIWLNRLIKKHPGVNVRGVADLGLNGWPFTRFRNLFYGCGLAVRYFAVNRGKNPLLRLFSLLRQLPLLEEYCSCSLYCVLEKKGHDDFLERPDVLPV